MPFIVLYLLKLSISLSAVWLFYQVLLRRLTFYNLNRWYLLCYSLLSFFIPIIDVAPMVDEQGVVQPVLVRMIPVIVDNMPAVSVTAAAAGGHGMRVDGWSALMGVLLLGSVIMLARLAISWMSLRGVRRRSKLLAYRGEHRGIRVFQVDAPIIPFSFGNDVFINKSLHTERELEEILAHERVHIRQKHTVDIVLAEFFLIVNWFNPFMWLIRRSIRQNLEFIADSRMMEKGYDKKAYQYHLLKVTGQSPYRLANNFNFSSLKKRIVMMNRIQSARVHILKFLFILPLIGVLLVSFRGRVSRLFNGAGPVVVNIAGIITDDQDLRPLAGVTILEKTSGITVLTDKRGFYKLPVPVKDGSARLELHISKDGYAGGVYGTVKSRLSQSCGLIYLETLHVKNDPRPGMTLITPLNQDLPADPEYTDVLSVFLSASEGAREDMAEEKKMQFQNDGKPHPPSVLGIGVSNGKLDISSSTGNKQDIPTILYVIDGVPGTFDTDVLTPRSVYSVDVLSTEKSQALYHDKCDRCVAIEITTRQNKDKRDVAKWGPYYSKGVLMSDNNKVLTYYH